MDNPEKLATLGTQDEDKQIKNTTQHALDTSMSKQTEKTYMMISSKGNLILKIFIAFSEQSPLLFTSDF